MGLQLSGLMSPPQAEKYVWFFDPAVDQDRSDFLAWVEDGRSGIELLGDAKPSTFHWAPLDPDQRDFIVRLQTAAYQREPSPLPVSQDPEAERSWVQMVGLYEGLGVRESVALGLQSVENLDVHFSRYPTPTGLRVGDAILRALRHESFTVRRTFLVPVPEDRERTDAMVERDGKLFVPMPRTVSLMSDLGTRIWMASLPTELQKKV